MVDVIVDQRFLRFADCLLHGVELLRQIETGPALAEHLDHSVKMPFGALQPFDDVGVAFVDMIV